MFFWYSSKNILNDLESRFSEFIVSVFGIGSYFDENLPPNWIKNDVDLVVIVSSLENIPKQDWTEIRYEKKQIEDKNVWIGFNSLEGVKNSEQFRKESFANYEWSLFDLKLSDNSALLYGRKIREELPEVIALEFDYDNILIRSLYHLNNSFKEGINLKAMQEFTKGVFKFGFYLCVYFDPQFRFILYYNMVISNSSPLIHLTRLGKIEYLFELVKKINIPEAVFDEVIVQGKKKIIFNI